jgi:hypothetical protein
MLTTSPPANAKPIPGFPDYCVSTEGVVYSRRVYGSRKRAIGPWWAMKLKRAKPTTIGYRYPYVDLFAEVGKPKRFGVHVLVMIAHVGPVPQGMLVCHKDDDPENNTLGNLYFGTKKSNMQDAIRNQKHGIGENHHNAKLSKAAVLEIQQASQQPFRFGEKINLCREFGERYGVSPRHVYKIMQRYERTAG